MQFDDVLCRVGGFVKRREVAHANHLMSRQLLQPQAQLGEPSERAFRADQQIRHVEGGATDPIDVVSGDVACNLGKPARNLVRLTIVERLHLTNQIGVAICGSRNCLSILSHHLLASELRAIGQQCVDRQHVTHHVSVFDGTGPGAVVASHASNGCAI